MFEYTNAGRSTNSHNMNTLQSALQQLGIEHPYIVDNNLINDINLYPDVIAPVACINTWNEEDDAFYHQLEKWGAEKVFSDHSETFTR